MGIAREVKVTASVVLLLALLQLQNLTWVTALTRCGNGVKCLSPSLCCSADGLCGSTSRYCGAGCQNGPCYFAKSSFGSYTHGTKSAGVAPAVAQAVTAEMFNTIFPSRNGFYTYEAFVDASQAFPSFGTTGSSSAQKRDVAAFLAHVYHETAGLTMTAAADTSADFCCSGARCAESDPANSFHCVPGKKYFARGPMQLTWNYNYGNAGEAVGADLLAQPELLSTDAVLSFKSAIWVWMSPAAITVADASNLSTKPSSHQVMVGPWAPSAADVAANRTPGFGATIDVLKGSEECGHASAAASARTGTYLQITTVIGVNAGPNLDCATMLPF